MRRSDVRLAVLTVLLLGCSPRYEPLVCDPDRAGEIVFGYQAAGAAFGPGSFGANGSALLLVDGACRYWTPLPGVPTSAIIVTGVLDEPTLARINDELLTGPWVAVDGITNVTGIDTDQVWLWRDDIVATGYGASSEHRTLYEAARRWTRSLADRGTPVAGPVRVEMNVTTDDGTAVPWAGTTPLADGLFGSSSVGAVRVDDPTDAATLRAMRGPEARPFLLDDGDRIVLTRVVDVVPGADALGCARPAPGDHFGDCRVTFNDPL